RFTCDLVGVHYPLSGQRCSMVFHATFAGERRFLRECFNGFKSASILGFTRNVVCLTLLRKLLLMLFTCLSELCFKIAKFPLHSCFMLVTLRRDPFAKRINFCVERTGACFMRVFELGVP